ncbi:NAD(P)H-hydrate dehydratase [Taibaiella koreensis]|uniref:NAD(P)H-hydrate dehydratase n=1 Tax=Taibaiella koreensis TaxID=1268548 RepID=UPI000E59A4A5|nr:NAD(P)H-hydrate dehydratase [Taibaiella koreensis]
MKIFSAQQIKEGDAFTIRQEGISSAALMERAAGSCYRWIAARYSRDTPVLVICGMGNNGGDGLALTRILLQEGFSARAVVLKHMEQFSPDATHNFTLLHQLAPDEVQILEQGMFVTGLPAHILIVDALFGAGLNRPLEDWPAAFVRELNELPNEKIAIDIPSGLPADSLSLPDAAVLRAQHTLSFQFRKRSFLHPEAIPFTGAVHVLDIGLSRTWQEATHSQYHTIDPETARSLYRPRQASGHKGTYGRAMLVGGSYGKMGAIALSTGAALRSGAGLVYTQAPSCGCDILQATHPEAMFLPDGEKHIVHIGNTNQATAIGIGPGMGQEPETAKALLAFLEQYDKPLVLDADGLNILSGKEEQLHLLTAASILTPHPKEFTRLFGSTRDSMFQVELGRAKAMKYNLCIVLKGHHTAVLLPNGECWYNTTGNPGMATGGSGDVLTGILTGLLAQGYPTRDAALLGVFLHGLAGDIAAKELSEEALLAGDLIHYLGKAFLSLR